MLKAGQGIQKQVYLSQYIFQQPFLNAPKFITQNVLANEITCYAVSSQDQLSQILLKVELP